MFGILNNSLDQPSDLSYDRPVFGIIVQYIAQHGISKSTAGAANDGHGIGNRQSSQPCQHRAQTIFTPWQRKLADQRIEVLEASLEGEKPAHSFPSDIVRNGWRIELPEWCQDQRNQMTGPADDADLCVKMLNSGAPGVMLDLEDSCVNEWSHHQTGVDNILACLRGQLSYYDKKRDRTVTIQPSSTVIFTRPRGLHLNQAGVIPDELVSASLFDVSRVFYGIDR